MDELDFEHHRQLNEQLVGRGGLENNEYFLHQAKQAHARSVLSALGDALARSVLLAPRLNNKNAKYFAIYGVGRRLRMIWVSYRHLLSLAPTDRIRPLSLDEDGESTQDINTMYINILGVLDNFAWCLYYDVVSRETRKFHRTKV